MRSSPAILDIANPFAPGHEILRLLEPADADRTVLLGKLLSGTYDKPFIAEDDETRALFFSWAYVQSRMRIHEPVALDLRYTRKMMAFLLFHTNPRTLLMLGLGGGSLAKYCHHHLAQARIAVVESNREVLAFRNQFAVPPDDGRFRVIEGEAGAFIAACRDRYDVVLMDAFDRHGLAPTLCGREFYEKLRTRLRPDGILVANIAGFRDERSGHIDTMKLVFGDNLLVLPVEEDDNDVVFAFRKPTFEPRWRWIERQVAELHCRYGLDFPMFARKLEHTRRSSSSISPTSRRHEGRRVGRPGAASSPSRRQQSPRAR
jgi:spermidine synthase